MSIEKAAGGKASVRYIRGILTNIATKYPDLVEKAERLIEEARVDDPKWPLSRPKRKKKK